MGKSNVKFVNWLLFVALSIIWGSSFVLMKQGMKALTPYQVAAIRMLCPGIIMMPSAIRHIRKIPSQKIGIIIISTLLGSLIPAFLFCVAETKIDSSVAGFLNSLTPIFAIITGIFFFNSKIQKGKIIGVLIAFIGMLILFLAKGTVTVQLLYASLVVIATICYGYNVNMAGKHLNDIPSIQIVSIGFSLMALPCFLILLLTGYFSLPLLQNTYLMATGAGLILGVIGTAFAYILYYMLLKTAGPLFTAMVTYGIPFVALGWGIFAGEQINASQVIGLVIILCGVYVASKFNIAKQS
jgi:drug/metabolite transporter (DMT)-like permease